MALFMSANYKTSGHVGIKLHKMTLVEGLIGTGAGPYFVSESLLHPTWRSRIKHRNFVLLESANKQLVNSEKMILLQLPNGNLRVCVWFGVVGNLAADLLLAMPFIDKVFEEFPSRA